MPERLNRYLARRGVASRRGADELIAAGRVAVNDAPAKLAEVIDPDTDVISVDGRAVKKETTNVTLMLNKPAGYVTTVKDPQGRLTVMNLVPLSPGLVPIGRLDFDSRGLLLFSNDGELVHRISHPRYEILKTYRVKLNRAPEPGVLDKLRGGVKLEDGLARCHDAKMTAGRSTVELRMGEGRKREVRRMFEALGYEVTDLLRTAVGPVRLGTLEEGKSRVLSPEESARLYKSVDLDE